jgi:cob(I)alamin adenosyltransferase
MTPAAESPRQTPRITRVTTRTGDDGLTGLVGGQRVPKDSPRIAAYGTVDELGAVLGLARVSLAAEAHDFAQPPDADKLARHLEYLQNQLFTLGGDLATRLEDRHPAMPVIAEGHIDWLERVGLAFNADLPPLKDFILAGASATAAALHVARAVCRRAERETLRLGREEPIGPHVLVYLNRLSDTLFILARWTNARLGRAESTWRRDLEEPPL